MRIIDLQKMMKDIADENCMLPCRLKLEHNVAG
jgi:hypothetical protein